jgi:hypothetical protein
VDGTTSLLNSKVIGHAAAGATVAAGSSFHEEGVQWVDNPQSVQRT